MGSCSLRPAARRGDPAMGQRLGVSALAQALGAGHQQTAPSRRDRFHWSQTPPTEESAHVEASPKKTLRGGPHPAPVGEEEGRRGPEPQA